MRQSVVGFCFLFAVALSSWGVAFAEAEVETKPTTAADDQVAIDMKQPTKAAVKVEAAAIGSDQVVDLFAARDAKDIEVKFIAKNDREARLLVTNKTDKPIKIQMPEAWVGVPVLKQIGGGGFGGGGMGGGGGGGQQALGGGGGGMGGGMGGGGMGGGGGAFSIPPDKTAKLDLNCLCIEHGKPIPSSSNKYEIQPVDVKVDRPEVVELLKAYGRGELNTNAAQAAVWHLNNDLSWNELASKLTGTRRNIVRNPYFSRAEIEAALAYTTEAQRRAEADKKSPATETESLGYEDN
jgi:hypothetical protein